MPESATRILLLFAGEDNPKLCTGRRLLALRLAERYDRAVRTPAPPVVLDPHAAVPLSPADRERARRGGLLAVDCSWNRLASRGALPEDGVSHRHARRLPWLIAANPQHFGRVAELNTAEAVAAALTVLGERSRATRFLQPFHGAHAFFSINAKMFERYAAARDADGILEAERSSFSPAPDR